MRNWNLSEDQLRRWTPRRPSAELRARVFGQPRIAEAAARSLSDLSRWLVPACGCFLLAVGSLSQRLPDARLLGGETNFLGAENSANSRIMLAEARQHSEINAVPAKRMQYSLGGAITQMVSPVAISYTNRLIQQ